ncbi:MAG: hypothetical protein FD120_2834, partial [Gammaproteobacteria bacterium]
RDSRATADAYKLRDNELDNVASRGAARAGNAAPSKFPADKAGGVVPSRTNASRAVSAAVIEQDQASISTVFVTGQDAMSVTGRSSQTGHYAADDPSQIRYARTKRERRQALGPDAPPSASGVGVEQHAPPSASGVGGGREPLSASGVGDRREPLSASGVSAGSRTKSNDVKPSRSARPVQTHVLQTQFSDGLLFGQVDSSRDRLPESDPLFHAPRFLIPAAIGSTTFRALLDTGATSNLLPFSVYERLLEKPALWPAEVKFMTADNKPLRIAGRVVTSTRSSRFRTTVVQCALLTRV